MFIRVKAHPKSKKESVVPKSDDRFEVFIREKPENGAANHAVLALLSKHLLISPKKLRIIKGALTPNKIIEIL